MVHVHPWFHTSYFILHKSCESLLAAARLLRHSRHADRFGSHARWVALGRVHKQLTRHTSGSMVPSLFGCLPAGEHDGRARACNSHTAPVYDRIHKLPESEWGKYWIQNITANGIATPFEITGTIMRVALSKLLAPGDSVTIAFPFR